VESSADFRVASAKCRQTTPDVILCTLITTGLKRASAILIMLAKGIAVLTLKQHIHEKIPPDEKRLFQVNSQVEKRKADSPMKLSL
jgi:hypothetical protein